MGWKASCLLISLLLQSASALAADGFIRLMASPNGLNITDQAFLYEDPTAELGLDDVAAMGFQTNFVAIDDVSLNVGVSDSVFWLKFTLPQAEQAASNSSLVIEVSPAFVDDLQLAWRDGVAWRYLYGGDQRPLGDRAVEHPNYLFPLPDAASSRVYYLRIESQGPVSAILRLWSNDALFAHTSKAQLAQGIYYAIMLSMLGYNLFLLVALRDPAYFYYVTYLAGMVLFLATFYGDLQLTLWPETQPLYNPLSVVFLLLSLFCGLYFARSISDSVVLVPRMDLVMRLVGLLSLLALIPVNLFYHLTVSWVPVIAVIAISCILHCLMLTALQGNRSARLTLLAFVSMIPGGIAMALRNLGYINVSYFSEHALQWGTAIEAFLLSLVLADRIDTLQREKRAADVALLDAERKSLAVQRNYSRRLLEAQDAERKRIARELHDGFGQSLAFFPNMLKRWIRKGASPDVAEYDEAIDLAKGMMSDIRLLSHNLHPHQLDKLGLKAALASIAEQAEQTSELSVSCEIEDMDALLSAEKKLHIYRVAQEAVNNIQRHANASRAEIQLSKEANRVTLRVTDDGCGIQKSEKGENLGLISMQERARAMDAQLQINGQPQKGTTVILRLPL